MARTHTNNPPAFPQHVAPAYRQESEVWGMTLRDYFAAKAMAALIDGYDYEARCKSHDAKDRTGFDDTPHADSNATYASGLAEEAYIIADAMLAERGEPEPPHRGTRENLSL